MIPGGMQGREQVRWGAPGRLGATADLRLDRDACPWMKEVTMTLTTRLLTEETWPDFSALVERNGGVWGGCWCMAFHAEGVGAGHTIAGNREAKRRHVENGTVHQVLVYDGEVCVGWCQFGRPAELPTIKNQRAYEKEADRLPDWRIGCIFTDPKHRGSGIATVAVSAALEHIADQGGGLVEAYPEQTEGRPEQRGTYLQTGPESLFERYGFARVRRIAKWRWVMRAAIVGT
jgi:GNAT superfamily N-acetyltransferase